jgi:hypothetical protein
MNEQTETVDQPMDQPAQANDVRPAAPSPETRTMTSIAPQAGCPTCGTQGLQA